MTWIKNPIRLFAVICVGVTSVFVMVMSNKLTNILSSPEWCGKALQAEKISSQNFGGLTACVDLLKIQLVSVSHVSLIYAGVIALCLLTLIVIVIAGARLDLKASATGIEANMDQSGAAAAGAQAATDSAQATASAIAAGAGAASPPTSPPTPPA
jgi:hypothetical protein